MIWGLLGQGIGDLDLDLGLTIFGFSGGEILYAY